MTRALRQRVRKWERDGAGQGPNYQPWVDVRQARSRGLSSRMPSRAAGRVVHLLSRLELDLFLMLDFNPRVLDIREQFPLLPLEATRDLAARLKIRHPTDKKGKPKALTSDFRVTWKRAGGRQEVVYAVKYSRSLLRPGARRVLELERLYWEGRGYDWRLLTEAQAPKTLTENLRWLAPFVGPATDPEAMGAAPVPAGQVFECLRGADAPLYEACHLADEQLGLESGTALTVARSELASRRWQADLRATRLPRGPLRGLRPGRGGGDAGGAHA